MPGTIPGDKETAINNTDNMPTAMELCLEDGTRIMHYVSLSAVCAMKKNLLGFSSGLLY